MRVTRFFLISLISLTLATGVNSAFAQFIIKVNTALGTGTGTLGDASTIASPSGQFFLRYGAPNTGVNITVKDITGATVLHTYTNVSAGLLIKNTDWGGTQTEYQIEYSTVTGIQFSGSGDKQKLTSIEQWGNSVWTQLSYAFYDCVNLTSVSTVDAPNISVTDLTAMFYNCSNLNGGNFNSWNTSSVTTMNSMFYNCDEFDQNIGSWDVSNVSNFGAMFGSCAKFNQFIGNWNVGNGTTFTHMFIATDAFNQNLGNWNVGNAIDMSSMFQSTKAFNQTLNWNTANVTNMQQMFYEAKAFNGNIGNWNTTNVTNMSFMFAFASAFNQSIGNWDTGNVTTMASMFQGASVFNQPLNNWNTTKVANMGLMFQNAVAFNQNLNNWDTGNVTTMQQMFHEAKAFNGDVTTWNTSKVTNMYYMFAYALNFNQPIGSWNTSEVTNMSAMFAYAIVFNRPLGAWNTSKVIYMDYMFQGAVAFNQNLNTWDTGNVNTMQQMFHTASVFNGNVTNWNTSKVTNMYYMFGSAVAFNQPIANWNTGLVTNMAGMFSSAFQFNQPIGNWNTGSVTDMGSMFYAATAFNQPIGSWNTSNVTNMHSMFLSANSFNQNLASLPIDNVTDMTYMLHTTALSQANYDATLTGWNAASNKKNNVPLGANGLTYCAAASDRYNLITANNWTITGDALGCTPGGVGSTLTWWLDASRGSQNAGVNVSAGQVDKWIGRNVITNTPPAVVQTNATEKPLLVANDLNFNPVMRFDGVNDKLASPTSFLNGYRNELAGTMGNYSVFMVGRFNADNKTILSHEDTTTPIQSTVTATGISNVNGVNTENLSNTAAVSGLKLVSYNLNAQQILPPVPPSVTSTVINGAFQTRINGVSDASGVSLQTLPNATGKYNVGGNSAGSSYFAGDLAEAVFYGTGTGFDATNRTRVESYLAIKYGITLAPGTAYTYESTNGSQIWTGNSTYQNHIAGIGRDDLTSQNQKQSQSTDAGSQLAIALNTINTAGNLAHTGTFSADNQFLVWGDNNGSISSLTTLPKPLSLGKRLQRVWRLQNTNGFNQQVTVYFPKASLTAIFGAMPYQLVYANQADFNGSLTVSVAPTGTQIINGIDYTAFQVTFPNTISPLFMSFGAGYKQVMVNPAGISTNIQNRRIKY